MSFDCACQTGFLPTISSEKIATLWVVYHIVLRRIEATLQTAKYTICYNSMRKNNLLHRAEHILLDQKREEAPWTLPQTILGLILSLVPRVLISLALAALGGSSKPASTHPLTMNADLTNAVILFVLNAIVQATFLIGPFYIARYVLLHSNMVPRVRSILSLLSFRSFKASTALPLVLACFIAIFSINVLYQLLLTALHLKVQTNDQTILQLGRVAPFTMYGLLILAVFIAPLCEEVLFRGFLFAGLMRGMPAPFAAILSAFIFAAAHNDPASFPVLFCIGLLLAFLRWRTRSLWPGILLHLLNNAWSAVSLLLVLHGVLHA
jgi:membrane protease YdiL (CAAX protease family)